MGTTDFKALLTKYWWAIPIVLILALFLFKKKRTSRRRRQPRYRGRFVPRSRGRRSGGRKLKFGSAAWRRKYARRIKRGRSKRKKAS